MQFHSEQEEEIGSVFTAEQYCVVDMIGENEGEIIVVVEFVDLNDEEYGLNRLLLLETEID